MQLSEWETGFIEGATLSASDARLAAQLGGEDGRVDIEELRTGVRVRARSWVGVVRFEGFEIQIVPKLAGENLGLVEMLACTLGLDALRRNLGTRGLELDKSMHLFDLLALILAEHCGRILVGGPYQDYVEEEDDLPVLRGRLLAARQLVRRPGRLDRIECRYDDRTGDVLENQILLAALAVCRARAVHRNVRRRVSPLHDAFASMCSLAGFDVRSAPQQLMYHRLNEHYREAHELAWQILEGSGIDDLFAVGRIRSFAFLLDMNRLFEVFVRRYVSWLLADQPVHVHYQRQDNSILWDATRRRPYTRVIPDLLLEPRTGTLGRLVIDAKYKTYDKTRVSVGDIYQSFVYAYAYSGHDASLPEAWLLYPTSKPDDPSLELWVQSNAGPPGARVQVKGLHIPSLLAEIRNGSPELAGELLREAILKALAAP